MNRGKGTVLAVALALIAVNLIIYIPARNYPFVNWDDPLYSLNSHVAHGLSWDNLSWAFTTGAAGNWHPLTWLSHMLDVQIFGVIAGPQHLVNLFLHICNSILLFVVLLRMTAALGRSAFVAGLFAAHPLHVESVVWVAERKDVLSTLFWMLTLLAYVEFVRQPSLARRIATIGIFALGLMAKPMLVTLPFELLLLDVWPLARVTDTGKWAAWRPLLVEKLPLFVLAIASSIITFEAQRNASVVASLEAIPLIARLSNAAVSYAEYIHRTFWPYGLAAFYPYEHFQWWRVAGSVFGLAAVSWASIRLRRKFPYLFTGWLWYLSTLLPVIGLIQVGTQSHADRYTYVPLIGLGIIIAWGIPDLLEHWKHRQLILTISAGFAICVCAIAGRAQVRYWENDTTLWTHAIEVTEGNYLAHSNLGLALAEHGKTQDAIAHYSEALRIKPELAEAYNNLGLALASQGKFSEAMTQYRAAIQSNPGLAQAHNNLGMALASQGKLSEAITAFQKALLLDPGNPLIYVNLGFAFARQGQTQDAIEQYSTALRIQPNNADCHNKLGSALLVLGRLEEAVSEYSEALRLQPNLAEAHNNLGLIQANQGNFNQAMAEYDQALQINPRLTDALRNKGVALASTGDPDKAIALFNKALSINPNDADAYINIGVVLTNLGKDAEAVEYYLKAIRIDPQIVNAHFNLGVAERNLGRKREAILEFREVLRLNPNHAQARQVLSELTDSK
jgi:tetratricopeptide (TPR) repeat protein